jgi:hypothetical protein
MNMLNSPKVLRKEKIVKKIDKQFILGGLTNGQRQIKGASGFFCKMRIR